MALEPRIPLQIPQHKFRKKHTEPEHDIIIVLLGIIFFLAVTYWIMK